MKKMYLILTFILSSFFFSSIVSAATYSVEIPDDVISIYNENIDSVIRISNTQAGSGYPYYLASYSTSSSDSAKPFRVTMTQFPISIRWSGSAFGIKQTGARVCDFNPSPWSISCRNVTDYTSDIFDSSRFLFAYRNDNVLPFTSNCAGDNSFSYTHNGVSYDITNGSSTCLVDNFPSMDVLISYFENPPTPSDNYPILTEFYTVFIDKLKYTADYFSHNYVFLSIFVVFIFMFAILLLRRLK